ncbi:hypothetical protein FACS1894139_17400 [Planctomycetales bacterium]|nr:hypothetical protein FACS1894139_17400 [Planctomycetales bacterium]GHV23952.1 hypothetical protein AGMMS49959_18910 [Planctomycetales bacterium]
MEFKVRLGRRKKLQHAIARKDHGYVRVKIRGRKRWVKAAAAHTEIKPK